MIDCLVLRLHAWVFSGGVLLWFFLGGGGVGWLQQCIIVTVKRPDSCSLCQGVI